MPSAHVRRSERGAALLTAMIIVTVVATIASGMVWQQWRAVQVEAAERSRQQSAWILSGALDWAKLLLSEDAKSGGPTALSEPWAMPLAEARLSTFLAVDQANTTDDNGPEAFLSGDITDAQSRYNLRNLLDPQTKSIDPRELAMVRSLFQSAGIAPDVVDRVANGIKDALTPSDAATASQDVPLMPQSVAQLAWLGLEPATTQRMAAVVVLLPVPTLVNLNTAPQEVLAAVLEVDLGMAQRLLQLRQRAPFKNVAEIEEQLPPHAKGQLRRATTTSSFFEVRGRLRLENRVLEERSLVERRGLEVVTLMRRRVTGLESQRD